VRREFKEYLKCGRLEHGFLRVRCTDCHVEKLVAFSRKRRGFCPSCGALRMVESAALLVEEVLPAVSMRQWVLRVPFAVRFLFASNSAAMGEALRIVYRPISGFLIHKAGLTRNTGQCGAVTLIQRFGSALNLNVHVHMLIPDGVYLTETDPPYLRGVSAPTGEELQALAQRISERIGWHLERKGRRATCAMH
jgi:ribosomal protein S27E